MTLVGRTAVCLESRGVHDAPRSSQGPTPGALQLNPDEAGALLMPPFGMPWLVGCLHAVYCFRWVVRVLQDQMRCIG